jgi:hypothetical protein
MHSNQHLGYGGKPNNSSVCTHAYYFRCVQKRPWDVYMETMYR